MRQKHFVGEEHVLVLTERGRLYAMLEVNAAEKRRMRWNRRRDNAETGNSGLSRSHTVSLFPKSRKVLQRV